MKTWKYEPITGYQFVVEIESGLKLVAAGAITGNEAKARAVLRLAGKAPELYITLRALFAEISKYNRIGFEGSELLELMSEAREMLAAAVGEPVNPSEFRHPFEPVEANPYCAKCGAGLLHGIHQ